MVGGFHGRGREGVVIPFRISTDALRRKLPYKPSEIVREALIMQFNFNNERHRTVPLRKTDGSQFVRFIGRGRRNFGQQFFFFFILFYIPSNDTRLFCRLCTTIQPGIIIGLEKSSKSKIIVWGWKILILLRFA